MDTSRIRFGHLFAATLLWLGAAAFAVPADGPVSGPLGSLFAAMGPAVAAAQSTEQPRRTVSVSGEGIVRVEPDMATVRFGVVTSADDPEEARRVNAEAAARAMNVVRELGIEERYMRLETMRLQPRRVWVDNLRRCEECVFEATRQVIVEIHDLERLPVLVARVVQEGANRLDQIAYDLRNRDAARNEALRSAVNHAREKASLVASTLGEEIGRALQVSEQSFDFPRPMIRAEAMHAAMALDEGEPDAYAAGEIEVRAVIQATFELGD
jgi:uncharacterized protein